MATGTKARFDPDELIAACVAANAEAEPRLAVRDVITRAVADPGAVGDSLRPARGGLTLLHHTPDLTVIHVVWAPGMTLFPHDHRMWAVIGIYARQEDNAFYRRSAPGARTLVESGGKELAEREVVALGDDTIHSVTNPLGRLTGAIHVYGGDFVNEPRSQWGPGPREERPFDLDEANRQFTEANEAWEARRPA
jgi:predicted metal-dependent enzyme (double-stranded beta helix superfamily)